MNKNPIDYSNGSATWTEEKDDKYLATGVDRNGKRFRITGLWGHIRGINIWRGNKWLVRNGKKFKIQSVFN